MMHPRLVLTCALLGLAPAACGPGTPLEQEPGVERGDSRAVDLDQLAITVSGRAELFPEAARLLEARGQPLPELGGLPLTIEEPLRVAVKDPGAVLGNGSISASGRFSIPDVPAREVHQSLATGLEHEGLVRSATVVFDTTFTGARPRTDIIDARAWALPLAFHDVLTQAVGESWIRALTEDRARTLRDAGFILGRVVDASGAPVAGARVVPDRADLAHRVYYPAADFTGSTQDATSATGLFVYVHSGSDAEAFRLSLQDTDAYLPRHAGVTPGQGLVLTLYPGSFPP